MKRILLFFISIACMASAEVSLYRALDTGSMKPTFDENYMLYGEKRPFYDVQVGDVIVYIRPSPIIIGNMEYSLVVHRVWQKSSGGNVLLCWGDANDSPDEYLITADMYVCTIFRWVTLEDFYKPCTLSTE